MLRQTGIGASLAALAVAGGIAGCGGSDHTGQVRGTLDRFTQAVAHGDYRTLCSGLLASNLTDRLAQVGVPCEQAMQRALGSVRSPRLQVRSVRVRGSSATAVVHTTAAGQAPSDDTVALVRQSGRWQISSLSAPPTR